MNKGKLEASKESPKPDSTPSSEKRYEVLYQAAVKKQKERDEKIQEFAGTDKECTFKPALVHQVRLHCMQYYMQDQLAPHLTRYHTHDPKTLSDEEGEGDGVS